MSYSEIEFVNIFAYNLYSMLKDKQNGFRRSQSTICQILTIHQIIEGLHAKNFKATLHISVKYLILEADERWIKYF